jgi:hypothetical protein
MQFQQVHRVLNITNEVTDPVITKPLDGTFTAVYPDASGMVRIRGEVVDLMDNRFGRVLLDFVPYVVPVAVTETESTPEPVNNSVETPVVDNKEPITAEEELSNGPASL